MATLILKTRKMSLGALVIAPRNKCRVLEPVFIIGPILTFQVPQSQRWIFLRSNHCFQAWATELDREGHISTELDFRSRSIIGKYLTRMRVDNSSGVLWSSISTFYSWDADPATQRPGAAKRRRCRVDAERGPMPADIALGKSIFLSSKFVIWLLTPRFQPSKEFLEFCRFALNIPDTKGHVNILFPMSIGHRAQSPPTWNSQSPYYYY